MIAIGLSKARRAGVDLPPPARGKTTEKTRRNAELAYDEGQKPSHGNVNPRRSAAITKALQREGLQVVSRAALSRQAKSQSHQRTAAERSAIGRKAAQTRMAHQSSGESKAAARKAARTRAGNH